VNPCRPKQPAFPVSGDASRIDVGVQGFGECMLAWQGVVMIVAFLVQPYNRPAPRGRKSSISTFKAPVVRANEYVSVAISARSRRSRNVSVGSRPLAEMRRYGSKKLVWSVKQLTGVVGGRGAF
jgi:hypothetical protein